MGALSRCAWPTATTLTGGWLPRAGRSRIASIQATTSIKSDRLQTQNAGCGKASLNRLGIGGTIMLSGQGRHLDRRTRPPGSLSPLLKSTGIAPSIHSHGYAAAFKARWHGIG